MKKKSLGEEFIGLIVSLISSALAFYLWYWVLKTYIIKDFLIENNYIKVERIV
jgi:hypothetical protein